MRLNNIYIALRNFLIIFLLGALPACNPQPEAPRLLAEAERLIDTFPDSAMLLIDSIFYPEASLRKPQYMQYLVARVRAHYKNYRPIADDSLIFTARDYFVSKDKNPYQTTLAYFYSGCVYREQENFEQAMQQYKQAEEYAAKTNDPDIKGLVQYNMGDLLAEQGLYAQALEKYKAAESLYGLSSVNSKEKQARCLAAVGRMFFLLKEQDSAFAAFHKGLELAKTSGNNELQCLLAQNLSVGYKEWGQYAKAEKYLRQSFAMEADSTELPRYYLNFAELYLQTGHTDSARLYINNLKKAVETSDDLYLKVSAYSFLGSDARISGDFNSAFDYLQKRSLLVEEITEKRLEQSVYEVQQKYDYQKHQNRHTRALLQQQRWGIVFLTLFLLASLAAITLLRRTLHQKNRLMSLQNTMQTLEKTAKDLRRKKPQDKQANHSQLREALLWKFDVQQKALRIKKELNLPDDQADINRMLAKFKEIVYGKNNISQWDALMTTVDELHPGFSSFIRTTYPQFSDTEQKCVCLPIPNSQAKK